MRARGFGDTWCGWIHCTLCTGKMAILLNSVPGCWFQCHRGLHQGNPISPYLFINFADILQKLLQRASSEGFVRHPMDASLPCPVLQYAGDTLILLKGDVSPASAGSEVSWTASPMLPVFTSTSTSPPSS